MANVSRHEKKQNRFASWLRFNKKKRALDFCFKNMKTTQRFHLYSVYWPKNVTKLSKWQNVRIACWEGGDLLLKKKHTNCLLWCIH